MLLFIVVDWVYCVNLILFDHFRSITIIYNVYKLYNSMSYISISLCICIEMSISNKEERKQDQEESLVLLFSPLFLLYVDFILKVNTHSIGCISSIYIIQSVVICVCISVP